MHALHELAEATSRNTGVRCVFECPQPVLISDAADRRPALPNHAGGDKQRTQHAGHVRFALAWSGTMRSCYLKWMTMARAFPIR